MGKGEINISISGGSGEFGNIVQGDKNKVSNTTQKALDDFYSALSELQKDNIASSEQVESLKQEVEQLVGDSNKSNLIDKTKALYKKYAWAVGPLQKLLQVIMP